MRPTLETPALLLPLVAAACCFFEPCREDREDTVSEKQAGPVPEVRDLGGPIAADPRLPEGVSRRAPRRPFVCLFVVFSSAWITVLLSPPALVARGASVFFRAFVFVSFRLACVTRSPDAIRTSRARRAPPVGRGGRCSYSFVLLFFFLFLAGPSSEVCPPPVAEALVHANSFFVHIRIPYIYIYGICIGNR